MVCGIARVMDPAQMLERGRGLPVGEGGHAAGVLGRAQHAPVPIGAPPPPRRRSAPRPAACRRASAATIACADCAMAAISGCPVPAASRSVSSAADVAILRFASWAASPPATSLRLSPARCPWTRSAVIDVSSSGLASSNAPTAVAASDVRPESRRLPAPARGLPELLHHHRAALDRSGEGEDGQQAGSPPRAARPSATLMIWPRTSGLPSDHQHWTAARRRGRAPAAIAAGRASSAMTMKRRDAMGPRPPPCRSLRGATTARPPVRLRAATARRDRAGGRRPALRPRS